MKSLILIKAIHSAIWLFMNVVIFYLSYAVISNKIDKWVWICISIVVVEGIILLFFKGTCPLTIMARKYSSSTKENFDIYLPVWLARYNKVIYSVVFFATVTLLIFRLIFNW